MAKKINSKEASVVSLRALCEKAGIKHHKVYCFINDKYHTLDHAEKTKLAITFHEEVTPFLKKLGYFIVIKRMEEPKG